MPPIYRGVLVIFRIDMFFGCVQTSDSLHGCKSYRSHLRKKRPENQRFQAAVLKASLFLHSASSSVIRCVAKKSRATSAPGIPSYI